MALMREETVYTEAIVTAALNEKYASSFQTVLSSPFKLDRLREITCQELLIPHYSKA